MYTGRFVHSGMAREELSPIGIEGADLNESVRGASVVEEPKVERARARNSWGPSRCPLLGMAGTGRARGEVQERSANYEDSRAVLEEAARSEEGEAS